MNGPAIAPRVITQAVRHDSDDPAIWLHPTDPAQSLIFGTDKNADGALYVFRLDGRAVPDRVVPALNRPNNVDVEYGLTLSGSRLDIAVTTERGSGKIRVHSLPEMRAVDDGGIQVFAGEREGRAMGIAMYKRPADGAIFAIISRKDGPTDGTYLWQYRLQDNGMGRVKATKIRAFGKYSGKGEIEAIAVDDALGFVYYSDERTGIRKYHADPDSAYANKELAVFGTTGFAKDREGIAIYPVSPHSGYVIVSNQACNTFHFFKREGEPRQPHEHRSVAVLRLSTQSTDGIEATAASLGTAFPNGMLITMSNDKTFHLYSWLDLLQGVDSLVSVSEPPRRRNEAGSPGP